MYSPVFMGIIDIQNPMEIKKNDNGEWTDTNVDNWAYNIGFSKSKMKDINLVIRSIFFVTSEILTINNFSLPKIRLFKKVAIDIFGESQIVTALHAFNELKTIMEHEDIISLWDKPQSIKYFKLILKQFEIDF